MSIGFVPPGGPGGFPWFMGEPYSSDPSVAPGLARPIGWEVRRPDGTGAWFKVGPLDTDWIAFSDLGGTKTLASVYAAGSGARSTADLMAMDSGTTLRFQANTDANTLPLIGAYETGASKPLTTSGYPAIGLSLATDLSILIGGRIFNWFEMFDPLWNGTFAQLAGYAWQAETCSFQQTAGTAWRRNHAFADRSYTATKNWQPQATPAGPLGSGPGTMLHRVDLYNTLDDALLPIDQLDGFGQNIRQVSPIQNGVIYETASHFSHRLVLAPAANDGVGWGVWDGDFNHGGDVPRAAWSARTVGASAAGDWYLAFSLQDTAGDGMLHDVASFARTGITFNVPVAFSLPNNQILPVVVETPVINLMNPGTTAYVMPLQAGKKFVTVAARLLLLTRDAALTTAPTVRFDQNGVAISTAQATSTAAINGFAAPLDLSLSSSSLQAPDVTSFPLQLTVTIGGAGIGLTTLTGKAVMLGYYE